MSTVELSKKCKIYDVKTKFGVVNDDGYIGYGKCNYYNITGNNLYYIYVILNIN